MLWKHGIFFLQKCFMADRLFEPEMIYGRIEPVTLRERERPE